MFRGDFRPKRHLSRNEIKLHGQKMPFFLKKTKSFESENEVLAPLTLRFLEKRRRFSTVKTPSFFSRSSIYLQLVVRQLVAKPSNTPKISMRQLSTEKFANHEVKRIENR